MYEDTRRTAEADRGEASRYLTAVVGHELNNLTTVLQGRLELARRAADDGEEVLRHVGELEQTELIEGVDFAAAIAEGAPSVQGFERPAASGLALIE